VDDDKSILISLMDVLNSEGYDVATAETGQEAIEKSGVKSFNLALLDIKLPDMEGTDLLVKMHRSIPRMMKIMLTGYPSLANAVKSVNLGADAYIMKPISPEELLKVIAKKLREQEKAEMMTQEKVAEWIKGRVKKLEEELGRKKE